MLDALVDRVPHRPELESHGDAFAPRFAADPGDPLPQERRIVERPEQVRDAEVAPIFVDRHEERIEKGTGRIDVFNPEFLECVARRRVDARDVHTAVLGQLERFLESGAVPLHLIGEGDDPNALFGHAGLGRHETREVEAFDEEA